MEIPERGKNIIEKVRKFKETKEEQLIIFQNRNQLLEQQLEKAVHKLTEKDEKITELKNIISVYKKILD